uniref:Vegetative insecticidal protein n=1 Tax=Bacillus thuringiensis TaxID=1428 RepID=Q4VYT0_BACTU|nr:vegetative insecticidal protein [Bacillus thuringiensis]
MNKNNTKLSTRALPSFIDYFNGIYGFATGIKDIMNMIFKTDTGGDLTLDEILKNQQLLNDISGKLDGVNGSLNDLIAQGNLNTELSKEILKIANEQNQVLNDVNNKLDAINTMLRVYLPKITSMLSDVMKQNYALSLQIEYLSKQLQEISDKLDIINVNVLINSTLTEITPAYQRIKYVNEKFEELTFATETSSKVKKDGSPADILDELTELTELAKSVTKNDVDGFEFYLNTFHDVMVGNNLFGRSALKTASELITKENVKTSGSEVGNVYNFLIVLTALQAKAFLTLTTCRKLLGLADIDYTSIMNEHLNKEKEEFRVNILPTLSNTFSNPNYAKVKGSDEDAKMIVEAKPGHALIGFEISNDSITVLKVYEAKLKQNYQVDKDSLSEVIYGDMDKLLCPDQSEQIYYTNNIVFPNEYVITKIDFTKKMKTLRYEVTANFYDSSTGEIGLNKKKVESSEAEYRTLSANDDGVYMPLGVISETFLTPINGFGLQADENSRLITLTCKSYLRELLLATDLSNKETKLIVPPSGFISNIVENGSIEEDNLEPWKANNKNAYVDHTGGVNGTKALYVHKDGGISQFIGDKLKPKTEYVIQYTVKGKPSIHLKDENTGYIHYEDTNNNLEDYQTINKRFTTGTDLKGVYLILKSQNGDEAWGDNFIILEISPSEKLLSPELINTNNWTSTGSTNISGNTLTLYQGGRGILKQNLQLDSFSTYRVYFSVSGDANVRIRNSREVLFEKRYMSGAKDVSEMFTTKFEKDNFYIELSQGNNLYGGPIVHFYDVSIK